MGILYVKTTGATTNSGSTDQDAANLSGAAGTDVGAVITLDGSPDLSGLVTSGASQSTIYLAASTVANRKIFWITAFDNTAKTVTVDTAPALTAGTSSWAIGGRIAWPASGSSFTSEASVRAGDILEFGDSPPANTVTIFTCRTSSSNTAGGPTIRGKSGTRPVLSVSGSAVQCITVNGQTGWNISNLELAQTHASNGVAISPGAGWTVSNVKVSDAGTNGMGATNFSNMIGCEITGTTGDGIAMAGSDITAIGCYIHDLTANGISQSNSTILMNIINCIIDTCGNNGIQRSGGPTTQGNLVLVYGNTVYGCGNSGYEATDTDVVTILMNNIFMNNGDAAGEYNVEIPSGATAEFYGYHGYNVFYKTSNNLSGLTANSTESTSDPLFTNAASGDFSISSSSPAKAAGYPGAFLGGPTGYLDIGAVQRQEATSSSTLGVIGS